MKIAVLRETREGEARVALVPGLVDKLRKLGYDVAVEPDAGLGAGHDDDAYVAAGALVSRDAVACRPGGLGAAAHRCARPARRRDGDPFLPSAEPVDGPHRHSCNRRSHL